MHYDLDRCVDRCDSCSAKWTAYDRDVLPLWVADMDFASPEPVIRALHERVEHGIFGYTRPPQELYTVIQERMYALYGWEITPDDIRFLPGVVTGFNVACRCVGEPGDGILVQPPVYYPFLSAPGNSNRTLQCAEVYRRGARYEVDFEEFEQAITERTRVFLFCNPHNPVGRVYEKDELARLAEICLRHGLTICSDEIHCDLLFSGHKHIPIASLDREIARHTITLMAPSKTFNIAGLHCAFAIIQDAGLRDRFCAAYGGLVPGVNLLGLTAALAAYREGQEWLDAVLAYLEANRDFVCRYVADHLPGVEMIVPEGTYLAWLDCHGTDIAGQPGKFFLEKARVALNEGAAFGRGGDGFVRLNFACPRSILAEALGRMQQALEQLS